MNFDMKQYRQKQQVRKTELKSNIVVTHNSSHNFIIDFF
jgi:hypothetical protein